MLIKNFQGNNSGTDFQASGAYVFRPKNQIPNDVSQEPLEVLTYSGPNVHEVHTQFSPFTSVVTRIYADTSEIEFEWLVGPIPVDDNIGELAESE